MLGEAGEVDRPEGERDEVPIVEVPEEVGVGGGSNGRLKGKELFEERSAVEVSAEGEFLEAAEVLGQRAIHGGVVAD